MKIVHLADNLPPYAGSFVSSLHAAAAAVRSRGWSFELALVGTDRWGPSWREGWEPGWVESFRDAEIPVQIALSRSRRHLTSWLQPQLPVDEPMLLHTHFARFDIPAALVARRRRDAHVVWHLHNRPERAPRTLVKFGVIARSVDRILCVSEEIERDAVALFAPSSRVSFLPNGIATSEFPLRTDEERLAARSQLRIGEHQRMLLHFGHHWLRKGGDHFLHAVRLLALEGEGVVGVTVGSGAKARALADQLQLGERLRMIDAGEVAPRTLYAAADLLVAPSHSEGMPFTVVEALCSGVPVVASDLPGHAFIADGLAAVHFAPLEAHGLTDVIKQTLAANTGGDADTATAARTMRERFDLDEWSRRLLQVYDEILAGD